MPSNSLTCNGPSRTLYQASSGSRVRVLTVRPVTECRLGFVPRADIGYAQACQSWWCSHPCGGVAPGWCGCPGPVPAGVSRTTGGRFGSWPPSSHRPRGQPASPPSAPRSVRDGGGPGQRIPCRASGSAGGRPTATPIHAPRSDPFKGDRDCMDC